MMNHNFYRTIINVLFIVLSISASAQNGVGLRCVVIDPGHGGKDPGAVAGSLYEKNINLGVALKLGAMIRESHPQVRVVYTRSNDSFVELSMRSEIANKADADLFISIHTNANPKSSPIGTETYVMGLDKGNRNLEVAMRENSVISFESDYSSRYEGYDPSSSESMIMFSMMQSAYLNQSLAFAELVQGNYAKGAMRVDKGVKQAGFLVLWRTSMPSVLTEVGFISNPEEARFLKSEEGQRKIARALFESVSAYKKRIEHATAIASSPAVEKQETSRAADEIVYYVQIKSSLEKVTVNSRNFGSYASKVEEKRLDGRYKYVVEPTNSYKEALLLQKKVRQHIPDAFVVAMRGSKIVPLSSIK